MKDKNKVKCCLYMKIWEVFVQKEGYEYENKIKVLWKTFIAAMHHII